MPDETFDTPAAGKQAEGSVHTVRELANPRELRIPFVKPVLHELDNGDLLIKDAPLLAEGEWTDSAVQTPLFYTAKALQEYAGNWLKKTGWNRHLHGKPRDESNRVAEAINPHFGQFADDQNTTHNAILSDILVYGSTVGGRAMQELIKRKVIKYLSVEHGGEEVFNPETRRVESKTLEFHGFAFVNKGACGVCRFNEAADAQPPQAPQAGTEVETMELKELEDKFTKDLAALNTQVAGFKTALEQSTAQNKELAAALTEAKAGKQAADEQIKALEARLKKIEDTPDPRSLSGKDAEGRALETPKAPRVIVDHNSKEVYRA